MEEKRRKKFKTRDGFGAGEKLYCENRVVRVNPCTYCGLLYKKIPWSLWANADTRSKNGVVFEEIIGSKDKFSIREGNKISLFRLTYAICWE